MFNGLNAFPLTPLNEQAIDEGAFARLVQRLATAGVDGITALGSTGAYTYLTREERAQVARIAVENAESVPVVVGVGSMRTKHVLELVEDAQNAGASGVLLAPVSYQALTPEDVYGLFEDVTAELSVPLAVYDNPGTTHFTFNDDLYQSIAALPHVASIKIPGLPADPVQAVDRVVALRAFLPEQVSVGISGDAFAATALNAGCEAWYSVIAGTLPVPALALTKAAQAGDAVRALEISKTLQPLWDLFSTFGSFRVVAAIAEQLELVTGSCVPLPIKGLDLAARAEVNRVLDMLQRAEIEIF